jgi:hypothetical protein
VAFRRNAGQRGLIEVSAAEALAAQLLECRRPPIDEIS